MTPPRYQHTGLEKQAVWRFLGRSAGALAQGFINSNWAGGAGRGLKSLAKHLPGDMKAGRLDRTKWQWDPSNRTVGDALYAMGDAKVTRIDDTIRKLEGQGRNGYATWLKAMRAAPGAARDVAAYGGLGMWGGGAAVDRMVGSNVENPITRLGKNMALYGYMAAPGKVLPPAILAASAVGVPAYHAAAGANWLLPKIPVFGDAYKSVRTAGADVWNGAVNAVLGDHLRDIKDTAVGAMRANKDELAAGLVFAPEYTLDQVDKTLNNPILQLLFSLQSKYGSNYAQDRENFKRVYGYYPDEQQPQ